MTPNSRYSSRSWILAGLLSALTAVGAFMRIPLPYVPFTLQLVFVLLSGDILTPKFAALSQIIYLLIGLLGLPVFANGSGPGYVAHPTFGYLAAFPIAAWVVARLLRSRFGGISSTASPQLRDFLVVNMIGMVVICILGVAYLYININYIVGGKLAIGTAIWTGMIIFIPGDIIKVILTSFLAKEIQNRLKQTWNK
jgi:biotin transport system substrate-specific component